MMAVKKTTKENKKVAISKSRIKKPTRQAISSEAKLLKRIKTEGITEVNIHVKVSKNNTMVNVTNLKGEALYRQSGGNYGGINKKKPEAQRRNRSSVSAAKGVYQSITKMLFNCSIYSVNKLIFCGTHGSGRETEALKVLINKNNDNDKKKSSEENVVKYSEEKLIIHCIEDRTPYAYNGTRARKVRKI